MLGVVFFMVLVERDFKILRLLYDWEFCLGRQIRELAGFSGQRATDRRLKKLRDEQLIDRKRVLYGVPSLYTVTNTGKKLIGADVKHDTKIRIDLINHNINVIDTAIYILDKYKISYESMTTEKTLHKADGFGKRRHRPDFIFFHSDKVYCVEVELTLKAKSRMKANLKDNYLEYDYQLWVVPNHQGKILEILRECKDLYPNIYTVPLEEVIKHVHNELD